MENEELNQVETEDVEQVEAAFDAEWDETQAADDDMDLSDDGAEAEPDAQPEEAEANEETDGAEAEAEAQPEEAKEAEPEQKQEAEDQRFKLKYNGEESEVDRDKVIELAQKGMDYDRIRQERDELKADGATMNRYKAQEAFLKELAESSEMTVEQLIENTRARMLMNQNEGMSEEEALKKVREANKATEKKESEEAKEPSPEERRQAMFANFLQAYPDVKAEDIPKEVWEDAGRTYDLTGAYQRYENRQLRKEIETLRQNNKNKERSTGSRKSVGSAKSKDDFDEGWDYDS